MRVSAPRLTSTTHATVNDWIRRFDVENFSSDDFSRIRHPHAYIDSDLEGYWKVLSRWVPHALTEPNARGNAVVGATVGQPQARRQSLCAPAPRLDQCTPRKAAEKVDLLQFTS
ncbi:hypothetical protein RB195_024586 [Necator americanus]|uniref:Uncharacterized protein n=1 Tax=Necator americanus TaxID=51031 RepID=A0ABR1ENU0_NECAM